MSFNNGTAAKPSISTSEEDGVLNLPGSSRLKRFLAFLWGVKVRLQFTGWLQYMPAALLALVFLFAASIARLSGSARAVGLLGLTGSTLLAITLFDLVTVKFKLRPRERLPHRNDDLDLFDLMRARRSCRSFQLRTLTSADYTELIESVRRNCEAPRLGGAAVRFEYINAPLTVWPVVNATEFLVAIVPSEYSRLAVIDVGRTLQKIVMDATRMGLGTCWIGPGADHASITRDLGDRFRPEKDHIICVCAVGYRSGYLPLLVRGMNAQFRRRQPLSALFFADPKFEKPLDIKADPFNRFGRTYEVCQWAPSSFNGQTTRCAAVMATDKGARRLKRFDFYAAAGSRYYAPVALGIWLANWELGCEDLGIRGRFAQLPIEEALAWSFRYDMSWIIEEGIS